MFPPSPLPPSAPNALSLLDAPPHLSIHSTNDPTLSVTTITRETNFTNDLHADSLDTVELVMEFEDEFETSIPDEQAEKIQTIGQAVDFIKEAIGADSEGSPSATT